MRILLQTVGTGGPDNPVWEALAFTVRDRQPQVLVQFCSRRSRSDTLPKFDAALGTSHHPEMVVQIVDCEDHDDIEALAALCRDTIDRLREGHPDAAIECDFTSGTKAMSAALVVAAVERGCGRLHYAVGRRDASGRATTTERLVSLDPVHSRADRALTSLGDLFNHGQFTAVEAQAKALAGQLDLAAAILHAKAVSLAFLAGAYEKWDRFDWSQARAQLRDYTKPKHRLADAGWDTDALGRQVAFLKAAAEQPQGRPPQDQRLADLLANAARCIARGRHDDAVARLYRLVEYVAQSRLLKRGIDPARRWTPDDLEPHAPNAASDLKHRVGGSFKLGQQESIAVLVELGDPVGHDLRDRCGDPAAGAVRGPLGQLLTKRNQSLLAHGSSPIAAEHAEALYTQVAAVLEFHLGDADHPRGAARLAELNTMATFLRCPWVP
jgi:CRISPR-associated protein, TIGR02710 family